MAPESFEPCSFGELPGWRSDAVAAAYGAFLRSARRHAVRPCADGHLGIASRDLAPAFAAARDQAEIEDDGRARSFFETWFRPFRIGAPGFVTAYYEPVVPASARPSPAFPVPLLAPPDDLVRLREGGERGDLPAGLAYARRTSRGLVPCHERREIERGALGDRARPIAWVTDRVEAFFIHVQGAARLRMEDGGELRVTYAAKSGHAFTGPGRLLVEMGDIPAETVSMQAIRAWFAANPHRVDEILQQNRSYIFFREAPVDDAGLGPVAAAKVPLAPGRSIAVDRPLHCFGTPFFLDVPDLAAFGERPFRRLMIAQDTGSAIVGAARADLFAGSGDVAGEMAGAVKERAVFYILVPRALAETWR